MDDAEQPPLPCPSPCVKRCGIDESLHCSGCLRTGREIAAWPKMSDPDRWDLLEVLARRRREGIPPSDQSELFDFALLKSMAFSLE